MERDADYADGSRQTKENEPRGWRHAWMTRLREREKAEMEGDEVRCGMRGV